MAACTRLASLLLLLLLVVGTVAPWGCPAASGATPGSLREAARAADARLPASVVGGRREVLRAVARLAGTGRTDAEIIRAFDLSAPVPVFLTGYYEPWLEARRSPDPRFRHPIYAPPTSRERASRAEIEAGALAGRGLELYWAADPIELFFLHVQGSGRLRLGDGSMIRIGFAATNGRPYRSIGALLVDQGVFASAAEATAPAIKRHLRSAPQEAGGILRANPRYVFFRELDLDPALGPIGSLGAPLVPLRSVAADPDYVPPGSVGLLEASWPGGRPLVGLVVAMDAGVAIRGEGRLDLFVGTGEEAAERAGTLRSRGRIRWLRRPRSAP